MTTQKQRNLKKIIVYQDKLISLLNEKTYLLATKKNILKYSSLVIKELIYKEHIKKLKS